MKKVILTISLALGIVATSLGQTVIIKSVEKAFGSSTVDKGLYITDATGKTAYIEYESGKYEKVNGVNTKLLQEQLNKYINEGYEISTSNGSGLPGQGLGIIFTTYILKKD